MAILKRVRRRRLVTVSIYTRPIFSLIIQYKYIFICSAIVLFIFEFILSSFNIQSNHSKSSKYYYNISGTLENKFNLSQTTGKHDICLVK